MSVSEPAQPGRDQETSLRYAGWRVVLTCFLLALFMFGFGLYGNGVYLAELQRLRGWPAAMISGAVTLSILIGNASVIFTDALIARLGLRGLVLGGIAALAASTVLIAMAREPWQLYLAFVLMSFGWTGMGTVVMATLVSQWFVHRLGLALSLAFCGASCGGVIVVPALVLLVQAIGFTAAMLTATAIMVVVLIPMIWLWIGPRPVGGAAFTTLAQTDTPVFTAPKALSRAAILRRLAFWTITAPFALALMAQVGFFVHQIALLEPKIGRSGAGFAVALTTAMAVVGRLGLGIIADRANPRRLAAVSFVSQAAALAVVIQTDHAAPLYLACAVFGLSVGNLITLPPMIMHREFEAENFTVAFGLSTAISGIVCALGPGLVGLVRGHSGGYGAALAVCIALQLVATAIVLRGSSLRAQDVVGDGRLIEGKIL
jgi:MFS family permease